MAGPSLVLPLSSEKVPVRCGAAVSPFLFGLSGFKPYSFDGLHEGALSVPLMLTFLPTLATVKTPVLVAVPIYIAMPRSKVEFDDGTTVITILVARDAAHVIASVGFIAGELFIKHLRVYVSGKAEKAGRYCQ